MLLYIYWRQRQAQTGLPAPPLIYRCKMASKSSTPAVQPAVQPAVCKYCGKHISRNASVTNAAGHKCAQLAATYTPAQLQAHYNAITGSVPAGYITVAAWGKAVRAAQPTTPGLTIAKLVRAIGGDRALQPPVHPICQVVYNGNQRWVNPWLATSQGLQALATGQWGKAPE